MRNDKVLEMQNELKKKKKKVRITTKNINFIRSNWKVS